MIAKAASAVSESKETLLDKLVALECDLRDEANDAISEARCRRLTATAKEIEHIMSRINRLGLADLLKGIMYGEGDWAD
jgi:hypothetical protein